MICPECGTDFEPVKPWSKRCGPECAKVRRQETHRLWHFKNQEKENAAAKIRAKEWVKNNPEQHRINCNKYAATHRDKCNLAIAKWTKANPDKAIAKTHRHRARKTGNGGSWTPQEWSNLKVKYGNKCLCCGRTEEELKEANLHLVPDHVVSVAMRATFMLPLGFLGSIENIQPLCHAVIKGSRNGCNQSKKDKYIDYRLDL